MRGEGEGGGAGELGGVAELIRLRMDCCGVAGQLIVAFKGDPVAAGFTRIKGGVRTERSSSSIQFSAIGFGLLHEENDKGEGA